MTTLYFSHPAFLEHDTGPGHPECATRLQAIDRTLAAPKFASLTKIRADLAPDIDNKVRLIHSQSMIQKVFGKIPTHGLAYLDADTVISPGSKRAALLAVSAACVAVDQVMSGTADNAFCATRPPGHHAEPERAMGFCLFNNVAIAAEYARTHYRLERIAIIDFDVHHGNGTQTAFYKQPQVFYASSHQWPFYPGSGAANDIGVGNILNLPLPAGTTGVTLQKKYTETLLPAVLAFNPQLILLSAGFDAHRDDPLASLELQTEDYRWLTRQIMSIADVCCDGRIVSLLEGGYALTALAESVATHIACLAGID